MDRDPSVDGYGPVLRFRDGEPSKLAVGLLVPSFGRSVGRFLASSRRRNDAYEKVFYRDNRKNFLRYRQTI